MVHQNPSVALLVAFSEPDVDSQADDLIQDNVHTVIIVKVWTKKDAGRSQIVGSQPQVRMQYNPMFFIIPRSWRH